MNQLLDAATSIVKDKFTKSLRRKIFAFCYFYSHNGNDMNPTRGPKPDTEKRATIERLLKEGKKPFQIIDSMGVSSNIITSVRRSMDWPEFPRGMWGRKKAAIAKAKVEALRLKIAGFTYEEIGKKIGVCRQRIQQYLKVPEELRKGRTDCCEKCGKSGIPLQCHHVDYETGEFQLLCKSCHAFEHHKQTPGFHLPERFKSNAS